MLNYHYHFIFVLYICYTAEEAFTSLGTEFYVAFPNNLELTPALSKANLRLRIATHEEDPVTITVQDVSRRPEEYITNREKSAEVEVDIKQKLRTISERSKGLKVESVNKKGVSVVALSEERTSGDLFLVLPPVYLPDHYEYYAVSVEEVMDEPIHMSAFLIVATDNNTSIRITPTQNVNISSAADITGSGIVGVPMLVTLNEMDTLYIFSLNDLSGSKVVSNKPITFISGHECGNLPATMEFCDQMFEQIPPTSTWGMEFFTAPLVSRENFDHYKFVSSEDNTSIKTVCDASREIQMQRAGDVISFDVSSDTFCSFSSNKPVLLVQFAVATTVDNVSADPFMMLIPPVKQYRNEYLITTFETKTPSTEEYFLNIVIKDDSDRNGVLLNGRAITDTWSPISCEGNNQMACAYGVQLSINVSDGAQTVSHDSSDVAFGVTVYSFGVRVGQGYAAGLNQKPVTCKCNETSTMCSSEENLFRNFGWVSRHLHVHLYQCVY